MLQFVSKFSVSTQKEQIICFKRNTSFQQMVLGKLDINMQKSDIGPLHYIIYKN